MKKIFLTLLSTLLIFTSINLYSQDNQEEEVKVTPYGMIRLMTAYETAKTNGDHIVTWSKAPMDTNGLFYMTADQSRFGFNASGFKLGDYKVTAKVELDFIKGGSETTPNPRLRHAFVKISNGTTSFLAGQTWDIVNPKFPRTVHLPPMWNGGNVGARHPQIRVEHKFSNFLLQAGFFPGLDKDYDMDGINDGQASSVPNVQARIASKFSLNENSNIELGFSGHYGKTKSYFANFNKSWDSYSANIDITFQINPSIRIISELFMGQNLAEVNGGIKNSINLAKDKAIKAKGFYTSLQIATSKKTDFTFNFGIDDPDDKDLNSGNRSKNSLIGVNFWYKFAKSLKIGAEVLNIKTDYLNKDECKTTRVGMVLVYTF